MSGFRRDLHKLAKSLGFEIELTNGGHYRLVHPQVPKVLFTSGTPGDRRVIRNIEGEMRRNLRAAGISP